MNKFFPTWQKAVGTVSMIVIGLVAYAFINKNFNVEQNLPNIKKA